jgi:hypothetical protein
MPPNEPDAGEEEVLLCPSALPNPNESVLIGVVSGTADEPRVIPTEYAMRVTQEIIDLAAPVPPGEIFRFAAPCRASGCVHFGDETCNIAARGVALLDEVTVRLPKCPIRSACRWFHQEGPDMCRRCPQVVTEQRLPSAEMLRIVNETDAPRRRPHHAEAPYPRDRGRAGPTSTAPARPHSGP